MPKSISFRKLFGIGKSSSARKNEPPWPKATGGGLGHSSGCTIPDTVERCAHTQCTLFLSDTGKTSSITNYVLNISRSSRVTSEQAKSTDKRETLSATPSFLPPSKSDSLVQRQSAASSALVPCNPGEGELDSFQHLS